MKLFSRLSPLLFAFVFFILPQTVSADQTGILIPSSDGNYLQWSPKTGSTHFTMVDETSCNGLTDYNSTTTVGNRDSYGISLSSIPDGATITQIDITPCASRSGSGGTNPVMNVFYRLNGIDSSDLGNYSLSGTTPVILGATSFTGLSTNKGPSSNLEIGAVLSSGTKGARVSQVSTIVTYTPLVSPSGLTAVATDSSHVLLNWVDNSTNEDGFRIERSDNGASFHEIATVSANITTFTDVNASVGGTFTYRVRAYNSGGNSGYTNTASATELAAPTDLSAVATGSAVTLNWTDNATNEAGFKIEVATNSGQFVEIKTVGPNVTTYATSGSPNDYTFRVRAYKGNDRSNYSNSATTTVLAAPSGLSASVNVSDVTLNWTDNSSNEDGFRIERADNGGSFVEINTVGPDVTTYLDPGLSSGSYIYRVRGYKGSNTSSYTATASANIP